MTYLNINCILSQNALFFTKKKKMFSRFLQENMMD